MEQAPDVTFKLSLKVIKAKDKNLSNYTPHIKCLTQCFLNYYSTKPMLETFNGSKLCQDLPSYDTTDPMFLFL